MKGSRRRPRVQVRASASGLVSLAGVQLLVETARVIGLDTALNSALSPWRTRSATHDPGTVLAHLAMGLAAGGDCPADVAALRAQPGLLGPVASDPTVSRLVHTLAGDPAALGAIRGARAAAHARLVDLSCPDGEGSEVVVDVDATLITAHSDKQGAAPTYKRGFGFHPLLAYLDHGPGGTGMPLAGMLRPGNANAGVAADHLAVLDLLLAQLTEAEQQRLVIRTDTAACTHGFLAALHDRGLGYSVGFYARDNVAAAISVLPAHAWTPAIDAEDQPREGAWVAELTALLDLSGWPAGLRVIARKERPHPGAQLRLTDPDGHRITCFATNHPSTDLPALELRHRRRARIEDRIREAKDTGLHNLPYRDLSANQIWVEIVLLAHTLLAATQQLALTGEHKVAEPKKLRLHLLAVAARLVTTGRRRILDLDRTWPWTPDILAALRRLQTIPAPT